MKKILLIATGGTIASEDSGDGLAPAIDANQLLSYIPDIKNTCYLDAISIMSIDSTDMNPSLVVKIAEAIEQNYADYDGFVVTHGTDTLAYTSALLTYVLQNVKKPVILTGSQLSIEEDYTDAKKNLSDAILFACEDILGVHVVFDGLLINGAHAKKMKTRNADAFFSINLPAVATIKHGKIDYNPLLIFEGYWDHTSIEMNGNFTIQTNLCDNIFILKLFPGMGPEIFDFIKEHYRGVIIEGFGLSGIPTNLHEKIIELTKAGIAVAVTTQCLYEGSDLSVYAVGKELTKQNVILAGDMTTEALTTKLMCSLGQYDNLPDIKKSMEKPYFFDRSY